MKQNKDPSQMFANTIKHAFDSQIKYPNNYHFSNTKICGSIVNDVYSNNF